MTTVHVPTERSLEGNVGHTCVTTSPVVLLVAFQVVVRGGVMFPFVPFVAFVQAVPVGSAVLVTVPPSPTVIVIVGLLTGSPVLFSITDKLTYQFPAHN